jgi:hypothetical protein
MYKIKLLILLLISCNFLSCSKSINQKEKIGLSIGHIGGGLEGILLKNTLESYLMAAEQYNSYSNLELKSNISHNDDIFITNIDNTSDRQRVSSTFTGIIYDKTNNCKVYDHTISISQFYIFAPNDKFISNSTANQKIRANNTNELVKLFINDMQNKEL